MLYLEIIAVCCEIHTEHTITLCVQAVEVPSVVVYTVSTRLQRHDVIS